MTHDGFLLLPMALGHVALFALVVNVVHGVGHSERLLSWAKVGFLTVFVLVSAGIAWEAWHAPFGAWSWPARVYGVACLATGLVLLPAATFYLHYRPARSGVRGRKEVVDLAARHGAALRGTGKYAWMLSLPANESLRLRSLDWEVPVARLPAALDGFSVLHLSDLHLSRTFDRRFFEAVFDEAAGLPSDLVVFTGDLIDDDAAADWIVPLLSRTKGRLGSFAVLGNHDLAHAPGRLRGLLVEAGFVDLEGAWATVEVEGKTIGLGGTSYPWGPPLPAAGPTRADLSILLSHTPDLFYQAERDGFDLMLAGHNHGGQVRLPLVGPVFMPSRYSRRFDRGFFRKNLLTLHVSQGVAAKHPVRYGCPPELVRLSLRTAGTAAGAAPSHVNTSVVHVPLDE